MTTIYCIKNPINDNVFYIGKTINLEQRKHQHLINQQNDSVALIFSEIQAAGKEPIFDVVEICEDQASGDRESFWIEFHATDENSLCNKQRNGKYQYPPKATRLFKPRKEHLVLSIDNNVKELAKRMANSQKRTFSAYVEMLLEQDLKQAGLLK